MSKKKKTPFGIFIQMFAKTIVVLLLMLAVGFSSYFITLNYYRSHDVPIDDTVKDVVLDIVSDAKVTDIAKNLICVAKSTGDISHAILEVFNTNTCRMDYITLPIDEDITISNDLYQRLYAVNAQIPQVIRLSNLYKYFDNNTVYEYAEIIIGQMLNTEISFYTIMPKKQYDTVFRTKKGFSDGTTTKITTYKKSFWKVCAGLKDEESIGDYMKTFYDEGLISNLSVGNRQKYAKKLAALQKSNIHFYPSVLKKSKAESDAVFDAEETSKLLADILTDSDRCYMEWKEKYTLANAEKSFDKNIYIANGARISGLASSYKEILVGEGYLITGIGNYDDEVITDTKILVREKGMGYDLLSFFSNASVEVADLPDNIDIEIILGTSDAG